MERLRCGHPLGDPLGECPQLPERPERTGVDHGDAQPFEDTAAYTAPRVRDRFSQQTLIDYAGAFGVRPFDADFYAPDRTATFVRHTGPSFYGSRISDLAEVQGPWKLGGPGAPDPDAVTERPPPAPLMDLPPGMTREVLPNTPPPGP